MDHREVRRLTALVFTYRAQLERVVDGDTLHVRCDLGLRLTYAMDVRLAAATPPRRPLSPARTRSPSPSGGSPSTPTTTAG
jgi:hypothetical protein